MTRLFLWLYCVAHGILIPDQGLNPQSLRWKCGVLTPRLLGKSLSFIFFLSLPFSFLLPFLPSFPELLKGFPDGSVVKNLPASAGHTRDKDSVPGSGRPPWRRKWQPTPVLLPGKSHGQRSLVGYSSWGHRDSDGTK